MFRNKKIISFVLMLIFITILIVGCGSITQIEKAQEKIVSIGEQFLDYELTVDEATKQLESITIPSTEGNGAFYLKTDKNYLGYLIIKTKNNSTIFDEIEEKIQYIKESNYNK